jgi:hypothetical protein
MGAYVLTIRYQDYKWFNYVKTTPLVSKHNATWTIIFFVNNITNKYLHYKIILKVIS